MTSRVFAQEIVLDHVEHEIRIDGVPFPYHVEVEPEVDVIEGMIGVLRIGVFAEEIRVITPENPSPAGEVTKAWCQHALSKIIETQMADEVRWLRKAGRPV